MDTLFPARSDRGRVCFAHQLKLLAYLCGILSVFTLRVAAQTNLLLVTTVTPAVFNHPNGVAVDGAGNLYVADASNNCIRLIAPNGTVTTLAGSTNGSSGTNDGTNTVALFNYPTGLCLDPATNLYVADYSNSTVRMISPMTVGMVTNWVTVTLAGQVTNFSFTNGFGANATFNRPFMLALDSATNLYVTDNGNQAVRRIAPGGNVTTYASNNYGFASPVGIAVDSSSNVYVSDNVNGAIYTIAPNSTVTTNTAALLNSPEGIALDASTNIYVANSGDNTILEIDTSSNVTTIAGTSNLIGGSANGFGPAAQFGAPIGLAVDASSNVYVADALNNTIREGTPFNSNQMAALTLNTAPSGLPLEVNGANYSFTPQLLGFATNSTITNTAATTNIGYAYGNNGLSTVSTNYYLFTNWTLNGSVTNAQTNYSFTLNSNVTLVANYLLLYALTVDISPANGGAVSPSGGMFLAGVTNTFTATTSNGFVFTNWTMTNGAVLSTSSNFNLALSSNETIVANFVPAFSVNVSASPANGGTVSAASASMSGTSLILASNSTVTATTTTNPGYAFIDWTFGVSNGPVASVSNPYPFPLDSNVTLVANFALTSPHIGVLEGTNVLTNNQTVNFGSDRQNPNGPSVTFTVTNAGGQTLNLTNITVPSGYTLLASPAPPSTIPFENSSNFIVQLTSTNVGVFAGPITISDNDPSDTPFTIQITGEVTALLQVRTLVVSTTGGLANFGATDGAGAVAKFLYPASVAVNAAGDIFVADPYNDTIREVTPTGVVTTLAGLAQTDGTNDGTGGTARFSAPFGVALDTLGNVYVADTYNSTIREITTNGAVTTFAGVSGLPQYRDGYVTNLGVRYATFSFPYGIAIDNSNNIYVADTTVNLIRKISDGFVTTLAGDNDPSDIANTNSAGLPGNSGSADSANASARFDQPEALAVDSAGNVYVADTDNNLIRFITPEGVVRTIAGTNGNGTFSSPSGIAVDGASNIYVADTDHQIVQVLIPSGTNWVVAPFSPLAGQTNASGEGLHGDLDGVYGSAVDSF